MKVDVKEYRSDDSSISIESGDTISIARDAKLVGIHTNNPPGFSNNDELWIFKRKAFLQAMAKALNVVICDTVPGDVELDHAGYYR